MAKTKDCTEIDVWIFHFDRICIFRDVLESDVLAKLYKLFCLIRDGNSFSNVVGAYSEFCYGLVKNKLFSLEEYIREQILYKCTAFWEYAEDTENFAEEIEPVVNADLMALWGISKISPQQIKDEICKAFDKDDRDVINRLAPYISSDRGVSFSYLSLKEFYKKNNYGLFAKGNAFLWSNGKFNEITNLSTMNFSDFVGFERQREIIKQNTLKLINGKNASNILLYGDRGTGKSSTIKAILNEYKDSSLRIIEIPKSNIADFHKVVSKIKHRNLSFIIFIDDLAFEDNEKEYTALKAVIEGGLEEKPYNVAIYATTNRRNIVKETFADRSIDEIHTADAMEEKLSLVDRFGIKITFSTPDQNAFFDIIYELATKRNLEYDREFLKTEGNKWLVRKNSRSPRSAKQFIDWISG